MRTETPISWQRTLWTMAAVQAIMMMAFSSMGPFLALFIGQLGVKNQHAVEVWAGVVASSNFLMSAIMSPIWGGVADKHGKKMMVMRTTLAIAIATCLMGFSRNVYELLIIRMLQGAFSGFSASANALVASVIPEERLGYALGWLSTFAMVGSLLGPLLGGVLVDTFHHNYRIVFFLTALFASTAFILTWLLVREPRVNAEHAASPRKRLSLIGQFKLLGEMKSIQVMFFVLFVAQFSVMSVQPVLPLYIRELADKSTQLVGILGTLSGICFAVTGLADLIFSPFLGKRSDRIGYKRVLSISLLGAALCYVPQALAPNIWVFILGRFGLGIFVGGVLPTANALVGRFTPREQRGRMYGFTSSSTFLGSFAGPLVGGAVSAAFGIRTMLLAVIGLYLINLIWVRLRVREFSDEQTADGV
ncbi:DHA1 family multidrug resistance protein-like MFS transporter [Alicyclobacillus sacchari]|uniref:DHA1 family multidrug resistance protein-like MFS transporter n=1 Tax=Alicyclobacillus sacchari TaxID=392010 RepID=A0A4R8LSZ3_9BACL|nr:MFS transporter [Alicyclobacillus sacchari]TDY49716.1 DHA1 family multidrug resistance protein-like MFS transporter [Alicyclobacillus sacchari]